MIFETHKETLILLVTTLSSSNIFLGHDWLTKHNPEIDWKLSESMPEGRHNRFRRWKKLRRASRAHWTLGKSSETTPAHWGSFAQSTQGSIRKTEGTGQLTWGSFAQSTQ